MAGVQEVLAERYELLEVLGRGGMGVVYRARDRVLERVVAIKVLPLDRAQDPVTVARFEREALAAAQLSHRNIVAVYDFGTDQETRFIVMEYVSGQSVAERLHERGALGVAEAVGVAAQIAEALAAAHAAGIVHRDIKPANVMIDQHGHVKVLDFGIARLTDGISLTQTATVIGSAAYMAPELVRGASADARSDLYALGCLLYELLAGRPPFSGELAAAVLHQQGNSTPQPLARLNPAVPASLDDLVVLRMLAKEPDDRPQDAAAVLVALAAAADTRADSAATQRLPQRQLADAPTTRMPPRRSPPREAPTIVMPRRDGATAPASHPRTRSRMLGAGLAFVLGVALLIVVLAGLGGSSGKPAADRGRKPPRTTTTAARHRATSTAATSTGTTGAAATGTGTTSATTATTSSTQTTSTNVASSPQGVTSAVAALNALAAGDVQQGTMAPPVAHAITADTQALGAASQGGQSAPAEAGLLKLARDITSAAQHGQISGAAVPALNAAVAGLAAAVQRSLGTAATTQTTAGPQPGGPHSSGPPPGQAKKHGDQFGQNDQ